MKIGFVYSTLAHRSTSSGGVALRAKRQRTVGNGWYIHTHTQTKKNTQSNGPRASTRVSVQTARAAETIQDMHYCDATKLEKTEAGADTARAAPDGNTGFRVRRTLSQPGRKGGETWSGAAVLHADHPASIFDVNRRSQGGEEGTWESGWGGGLAHTTELQQQQQPQLRTHTRPGTTRAPEERHQRHAVRCSTVPRRTVTLTAVLLLATVEDTHFAKGHSLVLLFTQRSVDIMPRWLQCHDSYGSMHL